MILYQKKTLKFLIILFVSAHAAFFSFSQSLDFNDQKKIEPLSKEIEKVYTELELPGLAIVVIKDREIIHDEALGYANIETKEKLTTDHLFWTASVTKVFTAATVMKLDMEGDLKLDDPIISFGIDRFFLPARVNKNITLRHLLTQTSEGEELGKNFIYGFRYNWLIAAFGGWKAFENSLKTKLLDHLNIDGLVSGYHSVKNSSLTIVMPSRFNKATKTYEISPQDRWENTMPATNLLASPKALAKAGQALNNGIGLPNRLSTLLNGELDHDSISDNNYGYGSFVSTIYGKRIIWQYGYGSAESALFIRVPSEKISIAILSNASTLSSVTRLGTGDLLKHPLADALLRNVILTDLNLQKSPNLNATIEDIESKLIERLDNNLGLDGHALLVQALVSYLKPTPEIQKSRELLELAVKLYPEIILEDSEPILWLITQHAEKKYTPIVNEQLKRAFKTNPLHPWYIGLAGEFFDAIGDKKTAKTYWLLNSNNQYYREHSQISDACLSLALDYQISQPEKALDLAWKALNMASWSFSWNQNQEARNLITRIVKQKNN